MQTTKKLVKLAGHEAEIEITLRHRTTLGRYEAVATDYPNLVGEGDTESKALIDLGEMLSSDPDALEEIEKKNDEAKEKAFQEEKQKKEEARQKARETPVTGGGPGGQVQTIDKSKTIGQETDAWGALAPNPNAGEGGTAGSEEKAGPNTAAGADKPESDSWTGGAKAGEAKDALKPADGAAIKKA